MNHLCRAILLLLIGELATGCITTSPEQQAKRNEERCEARGYKPTTDEFKDCVVRIESERTQRMETNRRDMMEKPGGPGTPRGY
ncbi:MAG: hypothetical protein WCG92_11285 [Hyphomicrobiales bacterium]|nr:hypothetical protein [Alphaproteobacteria bacterium]